MKPVATTAVTTEIRNQNHKNDATLSNRMGGSTFYCTATPLALQTWKLGIDKFANINTINNTTINTSHLSSEIFEPIEKKRWDSC